MGLVDAVLQWKQASTRRRDKAKMSKKKKRRREVALPWWDTNWLREVNP
jgi:hypothetical protein